MGIRVERNEQANFALGVGLSWGLLVSKEPALHSPPQLEDNRYRAYGIIFEKPPNANCPSRTGMTNVSFFWTIPEQVKNFPVQKSMVLRRIDIPPSELDAS